tara:strand:- start:133 stop:690 length:558 start_codon:yes stop_codon:yes gene_type:complete
MTISTSRILLASFVLTGSVGGQASSLDLKGSLFETVGNNYNIPASLLYSVALAESSLGTKSKVSPHPYAIRSEDGSFYPSSLVEAKEILDQQIATHGLNVDVGMMQISLYWQKGYYDSPFELLDLETNIKVGAAILTKCLNSSPNDIVIGVGRYHAWADVERSRIYGFRVLEIHNNVLESIGGEI